MAPSSLTFANRLTWLPPLSSPLANSAQERNCRCLQSQPASHLALHEKREMAGGTVRRLGVAMDFSPCSVKALTWTVDNVLKEGDHLILVVIRPAEYYEHGEMQLWEATGSPLIPVAEFSDPALLKKYGLKSEPEVFDIVNTAAKQKSVEVLLKIYWGDARERICEAIEHVPLDNIIMGNRGLGTLRRAIMGSVSNYVVNHASCPVTVVKSSGQRH